MADELDVLNLKEPADKVKLKEPEDERFELPSDLTEGLDDKESQVSSRKPKKNKSKKRKRKKKKHPVRNFFLILILLLAASGVFSWYFFEIKNVTYLNNTRNEEEALTKAIFGDYPNFIFYKLIGRKNAKIPFVQSYSVKYKSRDSVEVQIYEKPVIGYLKYMGTNMYFDKDGIVVENSTDDEKYGVPEVTGLEYASVIVGKQIDVGNPELFEKILNFTQAFARYSIPVTNVDFDEDGNATVLVGDVQVRLGNSGNMTDKMYQLSKLYPNLEGKKGILYMEDYDSTKSNIIFKSTEPKNS